MARDAWRFLVPLLACAAAAFALRWPAAGTAVLLVAAFVAYFFRDPERAVPEGSGLILAPADGRVVAVGPCKDVQGSLGEELTQVSIFLSVFDVHVNRAPIAGTVAERVYRRGQFLAAFADEASEQNEQNLLRVTSPRFECAVRQVAGLIARRIVCWVEAGDRLAAGQRIGLIRFGSRVDLLVPGDLPVRVGVGDRVVGGVTVLGEIR
jgi:phosphatidylserine decarboxylase